MLLNTISNNFVFNFFTQGLLLYPCFILGTQEDKNETLLLTSMSSFITLQALDFHADS